MMNGDSVSSMTTSMSANGRFISGEGDFVETLTIPDTGTDERAVLVISASNNVRADDNEFCQYKR